MGCTISYFARRLRSIIKENFCGDILTQMTFNYICFW